jgi:hypothetical protein
MESTPKFQRLSQAPLPGSDIYTHAAAEKLCLEEFSLFAFIVCYIKTLSASRINSVVDRTINIYKAVGGRRTGRGNRSTLRRPAPVPI